MRIRTERGGKKIFIRVRMRRDSIFRLWRLGFAERVVRGDWVQWASRRRMKERETILCYQRHDEKINGNGLCPLDSRHCQVLKLSVQQENVG